MRKIAAALAALALCATTLDARAATATGADYSDLWWNPAESGWGAHVTLQDDVLFTVLYVYDAQRQPRFFVAPDMRRGGGAGTAFEGILYQSSGPVFTGAFDPAGVTSRTVGTARMTFNGPGNATLEYSVDGAAVTKALSRQTWRTVALAGDYKGGLFATATPQTCPLGLPSIAYPGSINVQQVGADVVITANVAPGFAEWGICRMSGRIVQEGALASINNGTYSCEFSNSNVYNGTFSVTALEANANGFGGRFSGVEGAACQLSGYLGGTRRGYTIVTPEPDPEAMF